MSKKLILMTAAGLVSFTGAFVLAWFTKSPPVSEVSGEAGSSRPMLIGGIGTGEGVLEMPQPEAGATGAGDSEMKKAMTARQLKSLVYEVRENIEVYNNKLQGLEVREQRLRTAQDVLKNDIQSLNDLRVELASMVARLKTERDKLLKSRIEISRTEKDNLMSIAAAYDRMKAGNASKILTNMCMSGDPQAKVKVFGGKGSNMDDAVKILYYMTEKTKAKILAELVDSEPRLAAVLCQQLKQIVEGR